MCRFNVTSSMSILSSFLGSHDLFCFTSSMSFSLLFEKAVLAPPKPLQMGTDGHARFNSCNARMIDDLTGRIIIQRRKSTATWCLIIHHTFFLSFLIIGKCLRVIHHTLCGWLIIRFLLDPQKIPYHTLWIINFSWTQQQLPGAGMARCLKDIE